MYCKTGGGLADRDERERREYEVPGLRNGDAGGKPILHGMRCADGTVCAKPKSSVDGWPDAGTGCSPAGASGFDAVAPKFQHGDCTYFDIVDGARQRWRCAAAFRWVCRKEDIAGGRLIQA